MSDSSAPDLAAVARLLGDPSRATMMLALMDDSAWTMTELAHAAGVSAPTASEHVNRLVAAGLIAEVRQGRHRYLRLAHRDVAEAIESLSQIAPRRPARQSLRAQRADVAMATARTCYRHLAGRLGVALTDTWLSTGVLDDGWQLTHRGEQWFSERDIDVTPDSRRPLVRPCLDWTMRRPHTAGVLADRLTRAALDREWITRGDGRAVTLTPAGAAALQIATTTHP